jgi:hypothetical protein
MLERWRGFCAVDEMYRWGGEINALIRAEFLGAVLSAMNIQGRYDARSD